jgi:hypothetical protein
MKLTLFAISCLGFSVVSCGDSDKKKAHAGPSPQRPGLDLVGVTGFKNTARSAGDVGAKFNEVGKSAANVQFNRAKNLEPDVHASPLSLAGVRAFLSGEGTRGLDMPRIPSNPGPSNPGDAQSTLPTLPTADNLTSGQDCGSQLKSLDLVYQGASTGLRTAAEALQSFDGTLPAGITRGAADDQFAVTYTVDLHALSNANGGDAHPQLVSLPPSRATGVVSAPGNQSGSMPGNVSGLALIGAGANDNAAVLSIGIDGSMGGEAGSGSFKGGFVAAAYVKEQLLNLSANGRVNASIKGENGAPVNSHATFESLIKLQAGNSPSIALSVSGSGNGMPNGSAMNATQDDHAMSAAIKIEKLAGDDVLVTYKLVVDAQNNDGKVTFTTNAQGQCVVKDSTVKAPQ